MSRRADDSKPQIRTAEGSWGRRKDDALLECEICGDLRRTQSAMDSHKFHAHKIDRRKPTEEKTPPPPDKREREKPKPKDDGGGNSKKEKRSGSRWFDRPER